MTDDSTRHMSVLFIGHSYVRRARLHRLQHYFSTNLTIENVILHFNYIWRGGKNYAFFNSDEDTKKNIKFYSPDIILVALAGNAVSKSSYYDMPSANAEMRIFHNWLCFNFPYAKILPIEAEPRYNRHKELPRNHNPLLESYKSRRKAMNMAMARMSCKHGLIRVYSRLNDRKFYLRRDRTPYVHLNKLGNERFWELIINGLNYNLEKWGYLDKKIFYK